LELGRPLEQGLTKFPDEDKIESVQDRLFRIAWVESTLEVDAIKKTIKELNEVLSVWSKILASEKLSEILWSSYLSSLDAGGHPESLRLLQKVDLITCFFHHYIYAFDEFVNRKFRNSVIRCGLICERIVKRLAMGSGMREILDLPKFESKVGRLRSELEGKCEDIDDLANFLQYVYHKRTEKGAHDTTPATALIAKSCLTTVATIYLLYLQALYCVGQTIQPKDALVELVNSTISTGTTLVLSTEGSPTKPGQVIESLYRGRFFIERRTLTEIRSELAKLGYTFPTPTLFQVLRRLSGREGILLKEKRSYIQRLPPEEYFRKEIAA